VAYNPLTLVARLAHRGALRADLLRYYGLDLDQVLQRRTLRPSVLGDLVEHLPPDAALWRDIDPAAALTVDSHLLSLVANLLMDANWQRAGGRGERPEHIRLDQPDSGDVDRIALDGFDSPDSFDTWRQSRLGRPPGG